jgi:polar amino acid transport system permease protein
MLASWVLAVEGIHALLLMLEDVMNGGSSWPIWAYCAVGFGSLVAGVLVYSALRWAYLAAFAIGVATGVAVFPIPEGGFIAFSAVLTGLLALGYPAVGHPEAIQLASARVPWRVKLTVVQLVLAVSLVRMFIAFDFDLEWILDHAWSIISRGLPITLLISISAITLAIVLAVLGALGRLSRNPIAFGLSGFYTSFFRGTPLIVQLFLIYFGLAELGVRMRGSALESFGGLLILNTIVAAIIGIGLNYGAYMTEIFRAGIQSVGHGQGEAADALGMSYRQKMRRIVLPQAVRVIIPPTGNEFIAMTKDSALASTIGAIELLRRGELLGRADARTFEAFLVVAGVYWLLTAILTVFQSRLERKMGRGYVRTGDGGTKPTARKRSYLPAPPEQSEPGMTFVPGAGHGGVGGPGGAVFTTDEDGVTRSFGIDGTASEPRGEDGA